MIFIFCEKQQRFIESHILLGRNKTVLLGKTYGFTGGRELYLLN